MYEVLETSNHEVITRRRRKGLGYSDTVVDILFKKTRDLNFTV